MLRLQENELLKFNPGTLEEVRKLYGLEKPGAMNGAVDILEDWVIMQQHFVVKKFDRGYLERLIITCKGSLERAKSRLDKICTMRNLTPSYFGDYDLEKDYSDFEGKFYYSPAERLTKDNERVYSIKCEGKDFSKQMFLSGFRICIRHVEYLKEHDYANYYRFVVDVRNVSLADMVSAMGILDMRQMMLIMMEGYGVHIKAIHLISESKLIELLVALLRQVLNEKIGGRIQVHNCLEDLYKVVPKEVFPKDYGGDGLMMKEIHDKWYELMTSKEYMEHCIEINKACTDENLRPRDTFNEQYLGMPGTFRTLSVD